MDKLVILDLYGDLELGFNASLEIGEDRNYRPEIKVKANLPPARDIYTSYQNWHKSYYEINGSSSRIRVKEIQVKNVNIASRARECQNRANDLVDNFNSWLRSESFAAIAEECLKQLKSEDKVRIIVSTSDDRIRKLPWNSWEICSIYNCCEIALNSSSKAKRTRKKIQDDRVRILSILGSQGGINLAEDKQKLEQLGADSGAEITFLVEPSKQELDLNLADDRGWDAIFFSGHSKSEAEASRGKFYINDRECLTVRELKNSWELAAVRRLKIAFFNSCDGLGIAKELENLNIPQVIVMREAVPDLVAQEFLKDFLEEFSTGISLYESVNRARKKLQKLESTYPCASWLPVIVQNPLEDPPNWQNLGGIVSCPYKSLLAFHEEDKDLFFGREKVTLDIAKAVKKQSLVAIVGCSGSGKSSVVFAGLIPKLRQEKKINWEIVSFRPTNNPFLALAKAIGNSSNNPNRSSLLEILQNRIKNSNNKRILLVIDQFEELYTQTPERDRQPFLDLLIAATQITSRLTIVLTLRADFYGYALSYRPFSDLLEGKVKNLAPMNKQELYRAIVNPAKIKGVTFESGLAHKIIEQVQNNPGYLPLLEFALTQLWSQQEEAQLTHQSYCEIGGVSKALANYANTIYEKLDRTEKKRMQQIFMQLVNPGQETGNTRRLAKRDEINPENWDLVIKLASARLVVTNHDRSSKIETVEIAHEALITNWELIAEWIAIDGDFRRWQEQLRWAYRQWQKSDRDPNTLLRGKPLSDAAEWQRERFSELSDRELNFINLSLKEQKRQQTKRKRQQQLIIAGLSGGLILALNLTQNALISEIKALNSSAEALLGSDKQFEALLESLRAAKKLNGILGNLIFFTSDRNKSDLQKHNNLLLQEALYKIRERNRLEGHQNSVNRVEFSPDGQRIVTYSSDRTVKLWTVEGKLIKTFTRKGTAIQDFSFSPNREIIAITSDNLVKIVNYRGESLATFSADEKQVNSVSFSPDGQIIATAGADNNIKFWTLQGKLIKTFSGHQKPIYDLIFSPNGKIIAATYTDATVIVWNLETDKSKTLQGHQNWIWDETAQQAVFETIFSPDGETIVTASTDGKVILWNLQGEKIQTIQAHKDWIWDISFSSDGQTIATASRDKTVKLWRKDIENKTFKNIQTYEHQESVTSVVFSPDSQTIVSGSADKNAIVWNLAGEKFQTLQGHIDWVWDVSFSPDSQTIASASKDNTVKIWQIKGKKFPSVSAHQNIVNSVNFSPDGKIIATGSGDRTIKLWTSKGQLIKTILAHTQDGIESLAFSPDGQIIASASWDKTVKLWTNRGEYIRTIAGHKNSVLSVTFSPDGKIIATASADKTVKLWTSSGEDITTLKGHEDTVLSVVFSPDGQTIATSSWDKKIKIWTVTGEDIKTINAAHKDGIRSVVFSPDGKTIASASEDKTIKLWTNKGDYIKTIVGHTNPVNDVVFSPDGKTIASASEDTTIKLWTVTGEYITTYQGHDAEVNSISFSPDGNILASVDRNGKMILWDLTLNDREIRNYGCDWLDNYLQNNPNGKKYQNIC